MITAPFDYATLLRQRIGLIRRLRSGDQLIPKNVAVFGGPATQEICAWLTLFLLDRGIAPTLHQGEYNRYFEDTVLDSSGLATFKPDVVYLHLSSVLLLPTLRPTTTEDEFEAAVAGVMDRLRAVWKAIWSVSPCPIVQPTFEAPAVRPLGHLDATSFGGQAHFAHRLNLELAREARAQPGLLLHDAASLASSARVGAWFSLERWCAYKMPTSPEMDVVIAHSVAAVIAATFGRTRKCLVLDLDNTLWGGVIGDDGPDRIVIGRETPRGEAYTAFQEYCLRLRERGVLLAVCSKNNADVARLGFAHPDSVLRLTDFAAFRANWEPKHENIRSIAAELNIGLDSLVFVDDNPAERHLVASQLPSVAVPDVGADVTRFAEIVDAGRFFETVAISAEDLARTTLYTQNAERETRSASFADYGEYLASLAMEGEIEAFSPTYLDRITQLTNKTNQFNLTTRRYALAEMQAIAADANYLTLYGRLKDAFGDNGLVSVVVGRQVEHTLELDLWLMSCRVLKRGMEEAMFDVLVERARARGITRLLGTYIASGRNQMVEHHYRDLGFTPLAQDDPQRSTWTLDISDALPRRNLHIHLVRQ